MGEFAIVTIATVAILTPGLAELSLELDLGVFSLLLARSNLLSDLVLLRVAHCLDWALECRVE